MLEVIALDADDARAAEDGGADRVELCRALDVGGLSPAAATVERVRAAVGLPVRVMLRRRPDFLAGDRAALRRLARDLRNAGAEEFVLGFLDERGAVDTAALDGLVDGARWTFHRAIDSAADRPAAWRALAGRPGLDSVLTVGSPAGIDVAVIAGERHRPLIAGGGLRESHLEPLLAAGIRAFHAGTAVRGKEKIDAEKVRRWVTLIEDRGDRAEPVDRGGDGVARLHRDRRRQ